MRIAHGDTGHLVRLAFDFKVFIDDPVHAKARDRNLVACKNRFTHIDAHARDFAIFKLQMRHEDTRAGLNREFDLVRQAVVIKIACKAADAVAAHLCFAAIRIENTHAEIRLVRRQYIEHAIAANAIMTVAGFFRKRRKILYIFFEAVDEDKVIAASLPF